MKDKLLQINKKEAIKENPKGNQISKVDNNLGEDENNMLSLDKSLHCLRVELNRHTTIFLYYKVYPKKDSAKFPQERSAIFFYFDNQHIDEKFFHFYISCAGQIEQVEFGNYINRKGSSSKRRIVNFAIVKFDEKEALENLLNRLDMQLKINTVIERTKNRTVDFSYNPMEEINEQGEEIEEDQPDAEGFIEVKANKSNRFSKNGLSFRVMKKKKENLNKSNEEEEYDKIDGNNEEFETVRDNEAYSEKSIDQDDEDENIEKNKNKKNNNLKNGDFYWNFQIRDKKKQMYDQLKNLFEQDKQIIKDVNFKKRKIDNDHL